ENQEVVNSTALVPTEIIIPLESGATYWYQLVLTYTARNTNDGVEGGGSGGRGMCLRGRACLDRPRAMRWSTTRGFRSSRAGGFCCVLRRRRRRCVPRVRGRTISTRRLSTGLSRWVGFPVRR